LGNTRESENEKMPRRREGKSEVVGKRRREHVAEGRLWDSIEPPSILSRKSASGGPIMEETAC
jgi:hypothetical protein